MQSKKILIVEDDPAYLSLLSKKLSSVGYETIEASDGEDGLEKLGVTGADLILLDLLMPKKGGWSFMYSLAKTQHKSTPIIILTNLDKSAYPQDQAVVDYIVKSEVSLDEVTEKVNNYLNA